MKLTRGEFIKLGLATLVAKKLGLKGIAPNISFGEYLQRNNTRLKVRHFRYSQELKGDCGGFLVPKEFADKLMEALAKEEDIHYMDKLIGLPVSWVEPNDFITGRDVGDPLDFVMPREAEI